MAKEKVVYLAPEKPRKLFCVDCRCNDGPGVRRRLKYLRSFSEQWGCVVTRHDIYRCPNCRQKMVSTNGRTAELAADWV